MTLAATLTSIPVGTQPPYAVHVGPDALGRVAAGVASYSRTVVLTDANVDRLYGERLDELDAPRLVVAPGEDSKSFASLERVLDGLAANDLDRSSCLIALGGGVVGDLGGLAASLYMRGIAAVQVPTTLLAQVDSSVGGKTAVNLGAGKNLAGTFHQPAAVYADTRTLATLTEDEYRSGLGEALKTALLGGEAELRFLESHAEAIAQRDPEVLSLLVAQCVTTKARVVADDAQEQGARAQLNLGHTFGHAIEHAAGYGRIPHGIAVAAGLQLALEASRELEHLADPDLPERVGALLGALGLPTSLEALQTSFGVRLQASDFRAGLRHDKKGAAGDPRLVLPVRLGEALWNVQAPESYWSQLLAQLA